jgi:hypothetical protein
MDVGLNRVAFGYDSRDELERWVTGWTNSASCTARSATHTTDRV